jgi:hypothetical protein
MTRRLEFRPDALAAYRALRADLAGELGKRVKEALERLAADPGAARGECARWETLDGKAWALTVSGPEGPWLILWGDRPPGVVEVYYIGRAPGTAPALAWTSESE